MKRLFSMLLAFALVIQGSYPVIADLRYDLPNPSENQDLIKISYEQSKSSSFENISISGNNISIPEDLNNDGIVDMIDLDILKSFYGTSYGELGYDTRFDLNLDNVIDIYDITRVAKKIEIVNEFVEFEDLVLEKVIRQNINKPFGPISKCDVENITDLTYYGDKSEDKITSLAGIENFTNLAYLNIGHNNIRDFSPLYGLDNLVYLDIKANHVTSFSQLQNIKSLEFLDLSYIVSLEDLSELGDISHLKHLYINRTSVRDYSYLYNFRNIKYLQIEGNHIKDISFLGNMKQLEGLSIAENYVEDLSPLSNLIHLEELNIGRNKVKDISPIGSLKKLRWFLAQYNFIEDISPLQNCKSLYTIDLCGNYIKDISVLGSLNNVRDLNLVDNIISDVSPIYNMDLIDSIRIYGNPIKDMSPIVDKDIFNHWSSYLSIKQIEEAGKEAHRVIETIIGEGMTDIEKLEAIYAYVMDQTEYDYQFYNTRIPTKLDPGGIYGVLVDGFAVCDGYAHAMKVLGRLAGIDILYIWGYCVGSDSHAWNMININNQYYHIDATWDDGGQNITTDYRYFMISDNDIALHGHRTWDADLFPSTIVYDESYKNYCIDNNIPLDNYKTISGTVYTNEKVKEDLPFVVYIDVINDVTGQFYTVGANGKIHSGEAEYTYHIKIPNDKNISSYYLSYRLSTPKDYRIDANRHEYYTLYLQTGFYSSSGTATETKDRSMVSLIDTPKLNIPAQPNRYSIYDPSPADYQVKYQRNKPWGENFPYLIETTRDVVLPPYSVVVYHIGYEDEHIMKYNTIGSGNILAANHSDQEIIIPRGRILSGDPSIVGGMHVFYSIIIFENDFHEEDIIFNGTINRDDVQYTGRWIYDRTVERVDQGYTPTDPIGEISNGEYHNGNQHNGGVLLEKDGYYYISENDGNYNYQLARIDIDTKEKITLSDQVADNLTILGDYLYYRSTDLYRINLETLEKEILVREQQIEGGFNYFIHFTTDYIYYQSRTDYKLYRIDIKTLEVNCIGDHEFQDINVMGQDLYYRNSSDNGKIYRYNLITGEDTKISDIPITKNLILDGTDLYYSGQDSDTYYFYIYKMSLDGKTIERIDSTEGIYFNSLNIDNGVIYGLSYNRGLYKIDQDTSVEHLVTGTTFGNIIVGQRYIYIVGFNLTITHMLDK